MSDNKRKGAKSTKDILPEILVALNNGEIESANLVEWLAVNQILLLQNLLKNTNRISYFETINNLVIGLKKQTINTINEAIGLGLLHQIEANNDSELFTIISHHTSDMVRCWATYIIGLNENLSISEKLNQIKPFAANAHFGVREIAWLALRKSINENLLESIEIFKNWVVHEDENIRRYASEATRPRGVWCAHIEILKQNPDLALSILEPLHSDKSKYVQNSVANWLNDASKTQPTFVVQLCEKWQNYSNSKETLYIVTRAKRTLNK